LLFLLLLLLLGGFWLILLLCHSGYSLFRLAYDDGYYLLSRFWLMMLKYVVLLVALRWFRPTCGHRCEANKYSRVWSYSRRIRARYRSVRRPTDSNEIFPTRHLVMVRTTQNTDSNGLGNSVQFLDRTQ
jgi:polyferredoxin